MKKALFAVFLVMLAACTNRLETDRDDLQDYEDPFNGLNQIYDFSEVDTDNVNYWEEEGNGGLPNNEYKYIGGWKDSNGSYLRAIVIFDEHTKKPIYQYIDYEKPESYFAYGEEHRYDYNSVSLALLSDRLVIMIQYSTKNKLRTDYIQIHRDGSNTRETIKGAHGLMIRNWSDDTILFYDLDRSTFPTPNYIYNTSTSEVIFHGPFSLFEENSHNAKLYEIGHYIVSESNPLRFVCYKEYEREIQECVITEPSFTYPNIKQIMLHTGTTAIPFEDMFENFLSNGAQNPDIIELIKCEKLSYDSMLIEYQRTAFSGHKDTCNVIASIGKDGKTVFEIKK